MKVVILYGKPSAPYEILKNSIKDSIIKGNLKIKLKEIQDLDLFIEKKLEKIPAVQINNEIKNNKSDDFTAFVNEIKTWVMEKANYGELKKIYTPIDYSEASENALVYAKRLGDDINGMINIVHVYHPSANSIDLPKVSFDSIIESEEENLKQHVTQLNQAWVGKLESNNSIPFVGLLKVGLAVDVLEDLSNEADSLMVIGTKESNKTQKKWLGSVSTQMIKKSKSPLLLVPPKAQYQGFKNVLVCVNDTDIDIQASEKIISLIASNRPEVHLVHIGEDYKYNHKKIYKHWKEAYPFGGVRCNTIEHKAEANALEGYCQRYEIDLIVVARQEKNLWQKLFYSSFTKDLSIHSVIPVLVINN